MAEASAGGVKDVIVGLVAIVFIGKFVWSFMGPSEVDAIKALKALPQDTRLDRAIASTITGYRNAQSQKIEHDGNTTTVTVNCNAPASNTCGYELLEEFTKLVALAEQADAPLVGQKFRITYTTSLVDKYGNSAGEGQILSVDWSGDELAKMQNPTDSNSYIVAGLADRAKFGRFGLDSYIWLCETNNPGNIMRRFCSLAKRE